MLNKMAKCVFDQDSGSSNKSKTSKPEQDVSKQPGISEQTGIFNKYKKVCRSESSQDDNDVLKIHCNNIIESIHIKNNIIEPIDNVQSPSKSDTNPNSIIDNIELESEQKIKLFEEVLDIGQLKSRDQHEGILLFVKKSIKSANKFLLGEKNMSDAFYDDINIINCYLDMSNQKNYNNLNLLAQYNEKTRQSIKNYIQSLKNKPLNIYHVNTSLSYHVIDSGFINTFSDNTVSCMSRGSYFNGPGYRSPNIGLG